VELYGQVYQETTLGYNTNDVNDPNRKLFRASNFLRVVRGFRPFGAVDKRLRVDTPAIATSNQAMMAEMKKMCPGDMYFIKGTLVTLNGNARFVCPVCGKEFLVPAMYTFVNPTCIIGFDDLRAIAWDRAIESIIARKEISNHVAVMGRVSGDVRAFQTDQGQLIVNYSLDVQRKFHIKEDRSDVKHDFPVIKTYGPVAKDNYYHVVDGSEVMVDGMLQTRTFKRTITCPECENTAEYDDSTTEVVAYSTEYLYGCRTQEEVDELEKQDEAKQLNQSLERLGLLKSEE